MFRSYWENRITFSDMADVISWNIFETLLHHLHFVKNSGVTDETRRSIKLWKLKWWLCSLRENFLKVTHILRNFNQQMKLWCQGKGKSSLRQYMPAKPRKCGLNVWICSGFLYLCTILVFMDMFIKKRPIFDEILQAEL